MPDDDRGEDVQETMHLDESYAAIHEEPLRGNRLLRRHFKTVPVKLANGEEWQVAGPPLGDPGLVKEYEKSIAALDEAVQALGTRRGTVLPQMRAQRATLNAAFVILRQCYPGLNREQFNSIVDAELAGEILHASMNGEPMSTEEDERDELKVADVRERLAWCLTQSGVAGDAERMARIVVHGIPVTAEAGAPEAPNE